LPIATSEEVKQPSWSLPIFLSHLQTLRECPKGKLLLSNIGPGKCKLLGLISNPDKVRRSEREKRSFLKIPISRTCFPVRPGKANQSKNVVLVFRISRTAIVQISEPQQSIPLPIQCSDTKAL
jgi:hypothetical protein